MIKYVCVIKKSVQCCWAREGTVSLAFMVVCSLHQLIGRYTASGAYLLSSYKTAEEREEIWQKAKGESQKAKGKNTKLAVPTTYMSDSRNSVRKLGK